MPLTDIDIENAMEAIIFQNSKGANPIPDFLNYVYFRAPNLKTITQVKLLDLIAMDEFKADSLLYLDVPKSNFTLRPMSRPQVYDWILYEAVTKKIAELILEDPDIFPNSFSIRKFRGTTHNTHKHWVDHLQTCKKYFDEGYTHCVVTDITGYFEHINLSELRGIAEELIPESSDKKPLLNLLFKSLLRPWADSVETHIKNFGLPQGPDASLFLGDLFLYYLDRSLSKYPAYIRYMDDIKIFCKSELEAKEILKDITVSLRPLKLSLNSKKTKIYKERDIRNNLIDSKQKLLDSLNQSLFNGVSLAYVEDQLESLFIESIVTPDSNAFSSSHLRFSLYRLGILKANGVPINDDLVLGLIKNNFTEQPQFTPQFCDFFAYYKKDKKVAKYLFEYLEGAENIYVYQELFVLSTLIRIKAPISNNQKEFILKKIKDRQTNKFSRVYYSILLGSLGDNTDRNMIMKTFGEPKTRYEKMGLVIALQELNPPRRGKYYNWLIGNDPFMKDFVDYIKGLNNYVYYLDTPTRSLTIESIEKYEPEPY